MPLFSSKSFAIMIATALISAGPALSGSKPKGGVKIAPKSIINIYSGKTLFINSKKQQTQYFGAKGDFYATESNPDKVAKGIWYVTKTGRMCHEAKWKIVEDEKVKTLNKWKYCSNHVVDPEGIAWATGMDGSWHKVSYLKKGNLRRKQHNALSKKYGL